MLHNIPLITTLATALGLALIMGFIAIKLKLPTIVGYLFAGMLLGPFTPGFIADMEIAAELAEIGVMLLMFGVGLQFSLNHLLETKKIALPGAIIQITVATILGASVALFWGWDLSAALVFGLALSVASTVVLIRTLEAEGILGSTNGQIAVGWLVVEDLAMVLVLVLLPLMADLDTSGDSVQPHWLTIITLSFLKISSFLLVMLLVGRWILPKLLWHIARTGSRELFTLSVIAAAVTLAFGAAKIFGMSFALGAFFAGMIINESKFSRRAAEESLSFRDAFAVLFFVSVGMLFNPYIFIQQPLEVLAVVGIIVIGKSIAAAALVLAFRYPINTALTVSVSLAQIGEFSFILAGLGVQLKILSMEGQALILAGALISIAINPFIFKMIKPLQAWLRTKPALLKRLQRRDNLVELPDSTNIKYLSGQVVLVGYGCVGSHIATMLTKKSIPYVLIEQNRGLVENLRAAGVVAVTGDASDAEILKKAQIENADMLVIAITDAFDGRQMISIARTLNPDIEVAIRVENEEEAALLKQDIRGKFFFSEKELVKSMSCYIFKRFGIN
jgi:CPA2 family monovalent cation:H+ antiporter-2